MFLTFAFVIALMVIASRMFTKYVKGGTLGIRQSKFMKIVDTIAVGQDRYLIIVEINEKYYLVGSTTSDISILSKLEGDEIAARLSELKTPTDDLKGFSDVLKERLRKKQ
jgi:flagellar biosynthetic protein FliO